MAMGDKIKNKADELLGKGKQQAGKTANDDELRREGQADQAQAGVKQTGEKVKDAFKKR